MECKMTSLKILAKSKIFVNEIETFSIWTNSAMRSGPNFETNATPIFEVKLEIVRYKLQMSGYVFYEPLSRR